MELMNGFDVIFGVHFPNPDMLFDFIKNKIAKLDGVINIETLIRGNYFYYSNEAISLPSIWYSK